nr:hypothetical protein H0235_014500 [Vespula pensylvanica]
MGKEEMGAELKMDVLREREVKDSLERQLQDEQKVREQIMRILHRNHPKSSRGHPQRPSREAVNSEPS